MNNFLTKLVCAFISTIIFACGAVSAPKAPIHGETVIDTPAATQVASERFTKMNRPEFNSLGFHVLYEDVDCSVTVFRKGSDDVLGVFADADAARDHANLHLQATMCDETGTCYTDVDADYAFDERCGYAARDFAIAVK